TLQDMPTGWTIRTRQSTDDSGTICDIPSFTSKRLGYAEIEFTKGVHGPFLSEGVGVYERGAAKGLLDTAINVLAGCREWQSTDSSGETTTYQISPLSFPTIGDHTFAFRATTDAEGIPIQIDAVYVRTGDTLLVMSNAALGVAGPDSALTESMAKAAHEKLV